MATSCATLILLALYLSVPGYSSTFISENIVKHIIENSHPDVIPQTNLQQPVNVSIGLIPINIRNINFMAREVEIDAWLTLSWNSGLTLDHLYENVSKVSVSPSLIWRPDIELYNGDMTFTNNPASRKAVFTRGGNVLWVPKVKIRVLCDVDRFDTQAWSEITCRIKLGSWAHSEETIVLTSERKVDDTSYFGGSSFELLDSLVQKHTQAYVCCPEVYGHLLFELKFKKKSLF